MGTTTDITDSDLGIESLGSFRARLRSWLPGNMPRKPDQEPVRSGAERAAHLRAMQRIIWDGGFAGVCFPREYGGLGLTPDHQKVFNDETDGYDAPELLVYMPTTTILGATLLDFGTHEQKLKYLPPMLRGETLWCQFLSEPSGGSDLAGAITRADKDGDVYILNGSKIWTSFANHCDHALCLARTDWEQPKHRGLTMFVINLHDPAVLIRPIRRADGPSEFCQDFMTNLIVPASDVVGTLNDGWSVAARLLIHERNAVGGGSPYGKFSMRGVEGAGQTRLLELALESGAAHDSHIRQLVGEGLALGYVQEALVNRITVGQTTGKLAGPTGSILKVFGSNNSERISAISLEIAGAGAAAWMDGEVAGAASLSSLARQGGSLGGGSSEMQRNIIGERILQMPREHSADQGKPFKEVLTNQAKTV
jgi:alkylation response protein AidB-like acyl-CoA dehydrogenase